MYSILKLALNANQIDFDSDSDVCEFKIKSKIVLTHFQPMLHFYTPRKHKKQRFSDVFGGCRSGILVENGLIRFKSQSQFTSYKQKSVLKSQK